MRLLIFANSYNPLRSPNNFHLPLPQTLFLPNPLFDPGNNTLNTGKGSLKIMNFFTWLFSFGIDNFLYFGIFDNVLTGLSVFGDDVGCWEVQGFCFEEGLELFQLFVDGEAGEKGVLFDV